VVLERDQSFWVVRVPAGLEPVTFCVALAPGDTGSVTSPRAIPNDPPRRRWPHEVVGQVKLSAEKASYVVDRIDLPTNNPWQRAIRPGDVQFLPDGTGLIVTLDGDVWTLRGLRSAGRTVRWQRFKSGLHEPMTLPWQFATARFSPSTVKLRTAARKNDGR
jgi:hypothetical protein